MDDGHRQIGPAQATFLIEKLEAHIEECNKP